MQRLKGMKINTPNIKLPETGVWEPLVTVTNK
jgi:hypothetical protein